MCFFFAALCTWAYTVSNTKYVLQYNSNNVQQTVDIRWQILVPERSCGVQPGFVMGEGIGSF